MAEGFDWNERDREDRIVRAVYAVAAYLNPAGDVVIRQEAREYGDDDPFVIVDQVQHPRSKTMENNDG